MVDTYEKQLTKLNDEKERLEIFQQKMKEMIVQLSEMGVTIQNDNVLGRLTSKSLEVAEKQRFIDSLKEEVQECRDTLIEKNILMKKELEIVQNECIEQNNIIESCNKNRMDYSNVQEQVELIKEINRELLKHGINEEAHMAYEYVIELKDENWRNVIEAFLGVHRYAVIVSKDVFDVANAVLDKSRYRYVELVNTKRLMSKVIHSLYQRIYGFLLTDNADVVVDTGTHGVIFLHYSVGKNTGFDLFSLSVSNSEADGWIFMLIAHGNAPFVLFVAVGAIDNLAATGIYSL